MKGLLVKDLQLIFSNKTTFPVFIFISGMFLLTGDADSIFFVISYFTMLCGMMVLGTINYDELDHSCAYLFTLPITRKMYAVEKYVLTAFGILSGWLISCLASLAFCIARSYDIVILELFGGGLVISSALYLVLIILLPIQLKYGNERSRIAMITFGAIIMLVVVFGKKILDSLQIDSQNISQFINGFVDTTNIIILVVLLIIVIMIVTLLSFKISITIMKKKEY